MAKRIQHLDHLLKDWPHTFGEVAARLIKGRDGREVVQLRIDLGVLQMETSGRPDGERPEGHPTYYDYLLDAAVEEGLSFELDEKRRQEIDREFMQFYHRRIAWLAVRSFERAVADADHSLRLMDLSTAHAPVRAWADQHEQYRVFVMFHRTQARALHQLETADAEAAIEAINAGLRAIDRVEEARGLKEGRLSDSGAEELLGKLREMRRSLAEHYDVAPPLHDQLAEAIAQEQYERAAVLRDEIARRSS